MKVSACIAVFFLGLLIAMVVVLPAWKPLAVTQPNPEIMLEAASGEHWFGTDSLGRDVFARVMAGGRVSLLVGVVCAAFSLCFGTLYGFIAGWNGGFVDRVLMRFCDILMAIPNFVLVAVLVLVIEALLPIQDASLKALVSLCAGIGATHWMGIARVSRSMVQEFRVRPFVEAAVVVGGSPARIVVSHIFPHMVGTLLILAALQVPSNIVYESFLSFIGLGIQPPDTSWGILVRDGWKTLSSFPHLVLFPSMILFFTIWSIHVLLDYFRQSRRS